MIEPDSETMRNPRLEQGQERMRGTVKRLQLREPYSLLVVDTGEASHKYVRIPSALVRDVRRGSLVRMYVKPCSAALWEATSLQVEQPLPSDDHTQPIPQEQLDLNQSVELYIDPAGTMLLRDLIGRLMNALQRWPGAGGSEVQAARQHLAVQCVQYVQVLLTAHEPMVLEENELALKNLANEVRRLTK